MTSHSSPWANCGTRRLVGVALVLLVVAAGAVWFVGRDYVSFGGGLRFHANAQGARVADVTLHSRLLHRDVTQTEVVPAGAPGHGAPLLLLLHGKGSDQHSFEFAQLFRALHDLGRRAPVVLLVGGPEGSYWHDRASGRFGSYVMDEVIPFAVRRLHADPARVAIGGISMGGYGALELARENPSRFCAAGGHSAAVFFSGATSAAGAFDDAADFARHDLLAGAHPQALGARTRVWIDAGSSDPFAPALRQLSTRLGVALHTAPGGHDHAYWSSHIGRYLRFYADALAGCPKRR